MAVLSTASRHLKGISLIAAIVNLYNFTSTTEEFLHVITPN